jgi:hypothetical protein
VEAEIYPTEGFIEAFPISHVPEIELDSRVAIMLTHIVLLFLVATEDSNLSYASLQEPLKHSVAK